MKTVHTAKHTIIYCFEAAFVFLFPFLIPFHTSNTKQILYFNCNRIFCTLKMFNRQMLYASLPYTEGSEKKNYIFSIFHVIARKRENDVHNKFPSKNWTRKNQLFSLQERKYFFPNSNKIYFFLRTICHFFVWRWIKKLNQKKKKKLVNSNKGKVRAHRTLSEQNKKSTADWEEKKWNE